MNFRNKNAKSPKTEKLGQVDYRSFQGGDCSADRLIRKILFVLFLIDLGGYIF